MKKREKSENLKTFPLPEAENGIGGDTMIKGLRANNRRRPYLNGIGALNNAIHTGIDTDPFGSWTGTPTDDPDTMPIQDADDL